MCFHYFEIWSLGGTRNKELFSSYRVPFFACTENIYIKKWRVEDLHVAATVVLN